MALILQNSAFVLVPKTAGTWCHKALFEQGLVRGVLHSPENYPHPSTAQVKNALGGVFAFCFVRHPVSWLRSFWAAGVASQGLGVERIRFAPSPWHELSACHASTLQEFVGNYLKRCPGAVSRLIERYTVGADFIGRYENLHADLRRAFELAGESVDIDRMAKVEPINAGRSDEVPDEAAICRAEAGLVERFYP